MKKRGYCAEFQMLCFCRGKSFAEKTTVLQGDETVKTGGKVALIDEIFITLQAKTDVMTGMRFVWLLPLVALLMACGGKPTAQELVEVDSLLAVEKNDSSTIKLLRLTTLLRSRTRLTVRITICL